MKTESNGRRTISEMLTKNELMSIRSGESPWSNMSAPTRPEHDVSQRDKQRSAS